MAGGVWTTQNKVRPGAYVNVQGNGKVGTSETASGVVTMPLPLKFGPEAQVVEVTATTDLTPFGYDLSSADLLPLREAFKKASQVLLYRVGTGAKATKTEGSLTVTALYGGSRGNAISVIITANPNISGAFNVVTYLDGVSVDVQTVKTIAELKANRIVEFGGTGAIAAVSIALEGGTDVAPVANDYAKYFEAIQVYEFNTMALPVEDDAIKAAGASFIKRLRDEEGIKAQLVVANYDADHEAVINVSNGVILADGTKLSAAQCTAWVAGASAAAGVAGSLTYATYDNAVDANPRLTNTDTIDALKAGKFVFTEKRGTAVVEQDINSLHSFTATKGSDFRKNRVLRVLDDIANSSKKTFEDNYIGKVSNNADGRELFKADRIIYFDTLVAQEAIDTFSPDDIAVSAGKEKDSVYLEVAVQPIDAMEKLYMLVVVK
ncbi:phage tail sheath family protein [Enterococcus gallinarum]|uniref:phage tail sheath family protein n=1 Tax=Enterococcus gallinarum TaxID=1353 RepID=UPI002433AF10|nr:phage tail sheath family protein [Enterococcus gallinarum]